MEDTERRTNFVSYFALCWM